jgi:alpha-glucosidase
MLGRKYSGWSIVMVLVFGSASVNRAQSNLLEVTSPDHRLTLRFGVQAQKGQEAGQEGQLVYSVSFNEKAVFENSALGLELADQPPLGSAVHIDGTIAASGVDDYSLLAGKASTIHDAYNSLTVHAEEGASPGRKFRYRGARL